MTQCDPLLTSRDLMAKNLKKKMIFGPFYPGTIIFRRAAGVYKQLGFWEIARLSRVHHGTTGFYSPWISDDFRYNVKKHTSHDSKLMSHTSFDRGGMELNTLGRT